ncbi:hypothetical protein Ddye_003883 [Dipteronia dyeriana]|uniref:Uncharacterized protein n=1 Tax=Dipteronia dyeriana TaxID=168575 RepID=A0AAD9XT39_9ROSI|nr:hypothetical protein Ddye_003883 [Dipteronia dyeriana]
MTDAFGANSEVEVNDQSSQLVEAKPEVDVASHRPAGEQLMQLRTSSELSGSVRSNDTFKATSYFSPSSELSGTLEVNDQVPEQEVNSFKNPNRFVISIASEEITAKMNEFIVNGNPETRRQMRNLSYAMNNHRQWDRDELLWESTRHGHAAVRNGTRFVRD